MNKNFYFIAACCLFVPSFITFGQKTPTICSYYGSTRKIIPRDICDQASFVSNAGAEKTIDNILRQVGLDRNFIIMECASIDNCVAVNLPGEAGSLRYIIYDKAFLSRVQTRTGTDWSARSILAHEIGHHLQGHTLDGTGSRPSNELQADKFSGFVLRRLGASLKESQAAIQELQSIEGSATHPPKRERLNAIARGWEDANSLSPQQRLPIEESEVSYSPTASISKLTSEEYIRQGAIYYQKQQITKALTYFQYASDHNHKDTTAALYAGISAQKINKPDMTITFFNRYVYGGGKDPSVFYGLAKIHKENNNFDQAIYTLQTGLGRSPGNSDLKAEIVNILLASGKGDQAIDELLALTRSNPKNIQNLLNLGILYDNKCSRLADEIKEFRSKTSRNNDLEREKDKFQIYDGEVKRLNKLIQKQPSASDIKRQRDHVYANSQESLLRIREIERELSFLSTSPYGSNMERLNREIANKEAEIATAKNMAIFNYNRVLNINSSNYDALYNLGVLYFNDAVRIKRNVDNMTMVEYQKEGKKIEGQICGLFQKSKPYFEKAVRLQGSSDARNNLNTVNEVIGQFKQKNVVCISD